jgi:mannose-1-phosphate guanylyltransferase
MNWAIILAGGIGPQRSGAARPFLGDDRPKQFSTLRTGRSLFAQTRARVGQCVPESRNLHVVMRDHQAYYRTELAECQPLTTVEEPADRGTGAALAYGLSRLAWFDPEAIVGVFPADQCFDNLEVFCRAVETTYHVAAEHPHAVFVLGADAHRPESNCAWIEPGERVAASRAADIFTIQRFWDRPPPQTAAQLLKERCLWNTAVLIGAARAFWELMRLTSPSFTDRFTSLTQRRGAAAEEAISRAVYSSLPAMDFSSEILAARPDRAAVVRLSEAGWTDLGRVSRVETLIDSAHPDAGGRSASPLTLT